MGALHSRTFPLMHDELDIDYITCV